MAQIRNSLSMKLKGRAGAYTFYSSKGRQIARVSQNSTNYGESARRSLAQQTRRVKWSNLVNFYKLTSGVLHGAFETKRANETDYNAFMRKNLPIATVALTKEAAAAGSCVPQSYLVSEGSLLPVGYDWIDIEETKVAFIGLTASPNTIYNTLPISEFSSDVLADNVNLREGDQISVVWLMHTVREGVSYAKFDAIEITLSKSDSRLMSEVLQGQTLQATEDGDLVLSNLSDEVYFAVIISNSTSGQLKVSTASLLGVDTQDEETFSSAEAVSAAIKSYGIDPDRFLDSGDYKE